jgi:hypothetical protein
MAILANRKPERKPRPKRQRFIRLLVGFNADGHNAVIRIREVKGKRNPVETEDCYFLSRVPADFGEGFYVEKIGPEAEESRYHVHLSAPRGALMEWTNRRRPVVPPGVQAPDAPMRRSCPGRS